MPDVIASWIKGRQVEVITQGHAFVVDEPREHRGEGLGVSPLGLLRSALAACTVVTLLDVAEAQNIPIESLEVAIDSKFSVVMDESKLSWERRLRISRMIREIRVRGPITEEQKALLLKGAEFCPVENTLTNPVKIETTIVVEKSSQQSMQGVESHGTYMGWEQEDHPEDLLERGPRGRCGKPCRRLPLAEH
ncbi:MAG: OsmC family protein [Armatimonadota bacterium]|nr:OsmC family protein [Armatimonadota bacterium]